MKVSIITVCKNAGKSIEKTILSVIEQTYNKIEYIIIDGKSTDSTVNYIKKYERTVDRFVSENDSGIYEAMNKSISIASGEILLFLNAGDSFFHENIVSLAMKQMAAANADILFGNSLMVDTNTGATRFHGTPRPGRLYLFSKSIPHQATFYKKTLFEKFGLYNEQYRIASDHEFNLRLFLNRSVKKQYCNMIISLCPRGGISTLPENKPLCIRERREIEKDYFSRIERFLFSKKPVDKFGEAYRALFRVFREVFNR